MDAVLQLKHIQFSAEKNAQTLKPLARIDDLQDLLPLGDRDSQGRGDQIGEPPRLFDIHRKNIGLLREAAVELDDFLEQSQHGPH